MEYQFFYLIDNATDKFPKNALSPKVVPPILTADIKFGSDRTLTEIYFESFDT
jgi:hypothetical protein